MSLTLPVIVVALPFAAAVLLACTGSWRAGVGINAAAATLVFILACPLPWRLGNAFPALLALLTAFVAMTTSWFGWRDVRAALTARRLDRRSARHHHVAAQTLLGAILFAVLSESPAVTWLATTIAVAAAAGLTSAVRTMAAQRAASRLILLCGVGLMLSLFGTLLLYQAAGPGTASGQWGGSQLAVICLVLGYGGIAGLVPLHSWLPDAVAEGTTQGAILAGTLLANVPLLPFLRLRSAIADGPDTPTALFLALGLATLLLAAFWLATQPDMRRRLTFAGTALIGVVVFAFGLSSSAATFGGLLIMTMVTLVRASAFQCLGTAPSQFGDWTRTASVLGLAGLPIFALFLVAGATANYQPWLLLPLGAGVLLVAGSLLGGRPATGAARDVIRPATLLELAPVWLQLALVVLLAVAMPGPVAAWFRTMAAFR